MSKDNKNMNNNLIVILKTIFVIFILAVSMYVVMAIITNFSLNFENENYKFPQSLLSVFDFETPIFKFFAAFILLNIVWILIAIIINFIKKQIIK